MSKKEILVKTGKLSGESCVSIFVQVNPSDGQKNRCRLKELMFEAERRLLEQGMSPLKTAGMLLPVELLLDTPEFWRTQKESFVLFLTPTSFEQVSCPSQEYRV